MNTATFVNRSKGILTVTLIVGLVLIAACALLVYTLFDNWGEWGLMITTISSLLIIFAAIGWAACYWPVSLHWSQEGVTINRALGKTSIPATDIIEARTISGDAIKNSLRIFGSGGFGGYFGVFRNKELGNFTLYATNMSCDMLLLATNKKKYVISCKNPQAVAASFQKHK